MLCKKNKINSVLATIHFISATDVRICGTTSLLKCFRNVLTSLASFCAHATKYTKYSWGKLFVANLAALAGCVINTSRVMTTLVHLVLSPVHNERVSVRRPTHQIKLMLKIHIRIHTDARRRASTNLHTSNERCQFKLYMATPDNTGANDIIDNDVTDNDVIDSWMNMHTLLASCK